ncbi:MAG: DNA polymerase III subunit beta, partial [Treponema sp.]|nr:DNA polymerase III subunit beta [Treponema sp.]
EPLKVINSERITFEFSESMKAVTLRPEPAEDYFHIIMPMQMA